MNKNLKIIKEGSEILKSILESNGFAFSIDSEGSGSGGQFASASWSKGTRKLEYHFRYSLGLVTYHFENKCIEHEFLIWAFSGRKKVSNYPGYPKSELDGFENLNKDLNEYCSVFLSGSYDELKEKFEKAEELKKYWATLSPLKRVEVK